MREFGLLQPILVRPVAGQTDSYEIIAGERRWRAAQKAQLHEVPVVVRTIGDLDALQLGLVENLQRADLSAIDEALGYRRLSDEFNQTQEDIAKTVGKSRPHVANTVRLLDLPGAVHEMIRRDELSRWPGARPDRRARSAGHGAARGGREAHCPRPRAPGRRAQAQDQGRTAQGDWQRRHQERRHASRWRSASKKRWASRPSSNCAGWASRAC